MSTADQIMNNSMDFDLQEIIENRHSRESSRENIKEESMESQSFESRSYTDIALDDSIEKKLNDL